MDTDAAAFAEFYSSARDDCLRVVLATVRDRPTAEDLVAEAFARAWASWDITSDRTTSLICKLVPPSASRV